MATWELPATEPIDLEIRLAAGTISVTAEPTDMINVSLESDQPGEAGARAVASVRVEFSHGRLEIIEPTHLGLRRHSASFSLSVRVPVGSRCAVRTAASDVTCSGELGSLDVKSASGGLTADVVAGPLQAQTASGDVRVEDPRAGVNVRTGSGGVWLRHADGDASIGTASGDVEIGTVAAAVTVHSSAGGIRLARMTAGRADLASVSGDIWVAVTPGSGVYLDLTSVTGQVSSELDPAADEGGADLHIKGRTVSGELRVTKAAPVGGTT
jgi:DUF4097 and DUF4098 domain-containing protein YvlB